MASCWVSVEPPCIAAAARRVAHDRARDADGIDAEMLVEAPILDGDEGFGQIGRQVAEPHGRAAGVAAVGKHAAVDAQDLDVGRPLGHASWSIGGNWLA